MEEVVLSPGPGGLAAQYRDTRAGCTAQADSEDRRIFPVLKRVFGPCCLHYTVWVEDFFSPNHSGLAAVS